MMDLKLGSMSSAVVKLQNTPTRSGILEKRGNMWLAWRQRYFVLKDGRLEYSKIGSNKTAGVIPLTGEWKVFPWKFTGRDHAIILKSPFKGDREYYVSAPTAQIKDDWVKDLTLTIELLRETQPNRSQSTIPTPSSPSSTYQTIPLAPLQDSRMYFPSSHVSSPSQGPQHSDHVQIEMTTPNASKSDDDEQLISETNPVQQQSALRICCLSFCVWLATILFVVGSLVTAIVFTSKLDPNSRVWDLFVDVWGKVVDEYHTIETHVHELNHNYQLLIACGVALVLIAIVMLFCICLVRCRRNAGRDQRTFIALDEEGLTKKQQKQILLSFLTRVCYVLLWTLVLVFIAVVATSALDSDSRIWHRTVDAFDEFGQRFE
eukprot:c13351_g1_i1.p1 GENE.c13351_g1_i1~~c13351_g1_i1.p1  ORF type:complete len:375 (-),score=86.10 c13351_g1_i1:114-1238(-)